MRGLIACERRAHRRGQLRHVVGRRPARAAVVQHDRKHRRQLAARPELFAADEVLVEQARIDQHANRHVPVHRRLEFEQHHRVQPLRITEAHPPQTVALAPSQVLAHELRRELVKRFEVERVAPPHGRESAEQVLDHPRMREQVLVGGVLHERTVALPRSDPCSLRARRNRAAGAHFVGKCLAPRSVRPPGAGPEPKEMSMIARVGEPGRRARRRPAWCRARRSAAGGAWMLRASCRTEVRRRIGTGARYGRAARRPPRTR